MNRASLLGRAATGAVPLAASLALLTACGSERADPADAPASPPAYAKQRWRVESVTVDGRRHEAPRRARLAFGGRERARAEGDFGCNRFSARAAFGEDGARVRITAPTATKTACDGRTADFEKTLAALLTDAGLRAGASARRLTLTTPEGDTVTLDAERPRPLTGTTWEVTALTGAEEPGAASGTAAARPAPGRARLRIGEDGAVRGHLGCNGFSAHSEVTGDHLRVHRPASTRKLCPGAPMDTERALLRLFAQPLRYAIEGATLRLTAEDGSGLTATAREE